MALIRTFIDAGILLVAFQGQTQDAIKALALLDDPDREFASSSFLKLEVLPQATYHRRRSEIEFYNAFFGKVTHWANAAESLVLQASEQACRFGLHAMDALHVAAALQLGAEEVVTTEKLTKPIHRVTNLKIVHLLSLT